MVYTLIVIGLSVVEGAHLWGEVEEIFRCPDAWRAQIGCYWCLSTSIYGLFADNSWRSTDICIC